MPAQDRGYLIVIYGTLENQSETSIPTPLPFKTVNKEINMLLEFENFGKEIGSQAVLGAKNMHTFSREGQY